MAGKPYPLLFCMCLVLVVMPACGQTGPSLTPPPALQTFETLAPGDTTRSLSYGGEERTYVLHIPSAYDPSLATPLVLIFHGFGLNAEEMIRITGFNAQADLSGFVAVYPNGTGRKPSWNGGDCCGEAAAAKVDDVGFVRALIEDLSKSVNVDHKRIYAAGFSNGAMMAYRLACELSDQVAAIAPVGATQAVQTCQAGRPVSVLHFHGTNDQLNPYEGGYGPGGVVSFAPVKDTIQFWVKQNGCPVQAQAKEAGNIVNERYSPCAQDTAVELYTIVGGGHAWPGGESVSEEIGAPTTEILATPLIWEFFTAHPMP
jgi:polyhydroxybutyrate depolymerase